ncbi:MAG: hypothetical protein EB824_05210 [Thaumarchaeota archaeon S15]|nr:MAG: hypothetical protein EB832_03990 [Thaumarchaeota archaeon S14]RNJ73098.1 MAG: hypothetical protein EB824_05210 [Thaumarchaeota archaeon S15]RNJ74539.1 MAG: hypothetical protein EB833_00435 [Thaumarchaeota archaeon S13]
MNTPDATLVGKRVKDMHGAPIGYVVGTITDIDGTVQTVGVDRGSGGLEQIPHHQLVVQPDVVIYIPMWRLDSQKLLREKELALRRIKALMSIVRENDDMREDAELIHEKYRTKLASLDELQEQIRAKLEFRLAELDTQLKSVKTLIFDARVQNKSGEIDDEAFESVKSHTSRLVEQITREHAEITAVQRRITDLSVKVQEAMDPEVSLQDSAASYLGGDRAAAEKLPEAPTHSPPGADAGDIPRPPAPAPVPTAMGQPAPPEGADGAAPRTSWLARMESQ